MVDQSLHIWSIYLKNCWHGEITLSRKTFSKILRKYFAISGVKIAPLLGASLFYASPVSSMHLFLPRFILFNLHLSQKKTLFQGITNNDIHICENDHESQGTWTWRNTKDWVLVYKYFLCKLVFCLQTKAAKEEMWPWWWSPESTMMLYKHKHKHKHE